tara:strand:- start:3574 stop:3777 length:204 start_codon:yes stop_codon:yes gene_type:complete
VECSENIQKLKSLLKKKCDLLDEQNSILKDKLKEIQIIKRMKVLIKKLDIVVQQTKMIKKDIRSKLK